MAWSRVYSWFYSVAEAAAVGWVCATTETNVSIKEYLFNRNNCIDQGVSPFLPASCSLYACFNNRNGVLVSLVGTCQSGTNCCKSQVIASLGCFYWMYFCFDWRPCLGCSWNVLAWILGSWSCWNEKLTKSMNILLRFIQLFSTNLYPNKREQRSLQI